MNVKDVIAVLLNNISIIWPSTSTNIQVGLILVIYWILNKCKHSYIGINNHYDSIWFLCL